MAQHDFEIDNGPGLAVRTDMNAAIQALASQNSGPVEPADPLPGMVWLNTSVTPDGELMVRTQANDAWVEFLALTGDGGLVPGGAIISDTPPLLPQVGQLWWESDSGNTFLYYHDGTSGQWVQLNVGNPQYEYIASAAQDMRAGFKTGAKFVVNSKVDGTGVDRLSIAAADGATVLSSVTFSLNGASSAQAGWLVMNGGTAAPQASGLLAFNNAAGTRKGYIYSNSAGNMEFAADTGALSLVTVGTSQPLNLTAAGILNLIGGSAGWAIANGIFYNQNTTGSVAPLKVGYAGGGTQYGMTLKSGSSTGVAIEFGTSGGIAGTIQHGSGTTTAYNTTSDERLKDFIGEYDPDEAIRIIRADPVRDFHWRKNGEYAVGWGAQTSHAISPDLGSPPIPQEGKALTDDIDDPDFMPWGTDQSKRTPYLWAALSRALDKIDALEARLAQLEAR